MNGARGTYSIRIGYKMQECKCEANGNFVERYSFRLDEILWWILKEWDGMLWTGLI